ncbi:protein MTSS 1 [Trichonephila inaurata madagascariensis]|uniref:Protein MTSS 1 n=1 Tax=Trichonephila inaurata madagascariensis TaxID=2747483 RepID=A0A8X7CKC5_9ARAC|nr:protein MTSS 1 [Trichonephila inaurata madagascariensis]
MESFAEKECSALGGLFQYIVNDLKIATPVWEDFLGKASKLHTHLKATVLALAAFLDSFQKIADMATNARGATKDIGSALTRLCLRHRSVEAKLKIFSSALVDHLVIPLQEKLEDWKKVAYQMDKDHAKEYKRVRQDIKKKSSDTLRLQKKVRKTPKGDAKKTLDSAIRDVNNKYHLLEETEKQALRRALIEERSRYCLFVNCLRPVIESELSTMYEVTHIQEVLDALAKLIEDPLGLPSASEQVILDVKSCEAGWSFRTPPGSPTSVGSRKSSTCSISSLNSSSSDSTHSPSSHQRSRSLSQPPSGAFRLLSVSSQDSGFTSQDTLFTRLPTPPPLELADQVNPALKVVEDTVKESPSYPDAPSAMATWPNLQDTLQFEKAAASIAKSQRPHTISSAYERHNRPIITTHTFRPLQNDSDSQLSLSADGDCPPDLPPEDFADDCSEEATPTHKAYPPPLPLRAEEMDLSAPTVPPKPRVLMQQPKKSDLQAACSSGNNPIYVNASDICSASKPSTPVEAGSQEVSLKMSFQKDLAATLAQNAVHQKLKETTGNLNDQVVGSQNIATTPSEGACGGHAPPPPVRRSSATKQPPVVPPHRSTSGKEGTSWNVFSETTDGSDAHAQLMRALNARLDALQRDEEVLQIPDRLPPPPPPLKEATLEIPPRQASLRSAPSKKLPRTPDKIGGLEMKLVSSKFHTAPRPMETTKAQRRISQPTFSELLDQFPRNRNPTEDTAPLKRLPPTPDRRSSLDLEHANAQRGLVFEAANAQRSVIFETNTKRIASGNPNEAASRVQKWLAGRGSVDVSRCHADLLGEIRGGVNLRKANSDDRSAPILRHVRIKPPK